jgi:hypothetical protein
MNGEISFFYEIEVFFKHCTPLEALAILKTHKYFTGWYYVTFTSIKCNFYDESNVSKKDFTFFVIWILKKRLLGSENITPWLMEHISNIYNDLCVQIMIILLGIKLLHNVKNVLPIILGLLLQCEETLLNIFKQITRTVFLCYFFTLSQLLHSI